MEFGPAHQFLHLREAAYHRRHDSSRAGLQHAHHGGVVGRGQPNERGDVCRPRRPGGFLDLREGKSDVLLVEPDGIETAVKGDQFDELGMAELPQSEDAEQSIGTQGGLQIRGHHYSWIAIRNGRRRSKKKCPDRSELKFIEKKPLQATTCLIYNLIHRCLPVKVDRW